jgi:hypothetical protein
MEKIRSDLSKFYQRCDYESKFLTKEELDEIANKVYDDIDFQRNVKETSEAINIPIEICDVVIKQYIRSVLGFMFKIHKYKIVITIYGLMFIDISNTIFQEDSKYFYKKYKSISKELRKSITKTKNNNKLKF